LVVTSLLGGTEQDAAESDPAKSHQARVSVSPQEEVLDPQQWLDEYEARLADLQQKSVDLQENLTASNATVTSKDGAVTITVGPNGGLLNLQLGHRAMELGSARLTATIMETARTAQRQSAEKVREIFEPLGEGTEAMSMVMDAIPDDESDPDEIEEVDDLDDLDDEPVAPPPAYAPPAPAAVRAPGRPRPAADEDDENHPW
jgi:DNA-binding protein YbaB